MISLLFFQNNLLFYWQVAACRDTGFEFFEQMLENVSKTIFFYIDVISKNIFLNTSWHSCNFMVSLISSYLKKTRMAISIRVPWRLVVRSWTVWWRMSSVWRKGVWVRPRHTDLLKNLCSQNYSLLSLSCFHSFTTTWLFSFQYLLVFLWQIIEMILHKLHCTMAIVRENLYMSVCIEWVVLQHFSLHFVWNLL